MSKKDKVAPRRLYNCEPCTLVIEGVALQPGPDGNSVPFEAYSRLKQNAKFQGYVRDGSIKADKYVPRTAIRPHSIPRIDLGNPAEQPRGAKRRAGPPMITPGAPDPMLLAEVASDPKVLESEIERAKALVAALEGARSTPDKAEKAKSGAKRAKGEPSKADPTPERAGSESKTAEVKAEIAGSEPEKTDPRAPAGKR